MREVKSIGINYDRLSYAFLSPIAGFVIVGAIIKNAYSYINNPKFFILLFFLSITLAFYFFLKSFNVLIVDSFGIEFKYLLLPIKSIKKRWTQINSYATVKIKRKGSRHQIIYSRSELWFIDSNDMLVFKTYKKGRTNLNEVIAMIDRFISKTVIDLENTNPYSSSKGKSKVIYKEKLTK
jgi:hypothetical protein